MPKGSRDHECQASARLSRPVTATEGLPACLPDSTRAAAPVRRRAACDHPEPRSGWAECHLKVGGGGGGRGEAVGSSGGGGGRRGGSASVVAAGRRGRLASSSSAP